MKKKNKIKVIVVTGFAIAVIGFFSYGYSKTILQRELEAKAQEIRPVIIYQSIPPRKALPAATVETEIEEETEEAAPVEDIAEEIKADEMELLAQVVEAEAGGEEYLGKCLVVDVILNRVKSEDFPDTITEVIYQPYQFACVLDGGLDRAGYRMQEDDYKAVEQELKEQIDYSIVFFTAEGYSPYCKPCYKVGGHYFGEGKDNDN